MFLYTLRAKMINISVYQKLAVIVQSKFRLDQYRQHISSVCQDNFQVCVYLIYKDKQFYSFCAKTWYKRLELPVVMFFKVGLVQIGLKINTDIKFALNSVLSILVLIKHFHLHHSCFSII